MGRPRKNGDNVNDKTDSKNKRMKKRKKDRKSDPIVNDISALLSSSLCFVSPNSSLDTENTKTPVNNEKGKKRKRNSKSMSPNVSSSSLDAFVVRTPKKTQGKESDRVKKIELKEENCDKTKEVWVIDEETSAKENKNGVSKKQLKKTKDESKKQMNFENLIENDILDVEATSTPQEKKNAFQFMMDSRNKSIGSNSPGKEVMIKENVPRDKEKLSARKSLLQNWADKKGGLKRKKEDEELDECIAFKMEVRAKRLKKLLNTSNKSNSPSKEIQITLDSDIDSSQESCVNSDTKNKKSRNLDGFLGILNKKKPEENDEEEDVHVYDSDKDTPQEVLKIKMFSPQILKRKKHRAQTPTINLVEKTIKDKLPKQQNSKPKKNKKNLHALYSENSDASNDSDTFILRRSTRKRIAQTRVLSISENEDSNDSIIDLVEENEKKKREKPAKMAPVFLLSAPKPKVDPEVLEAKKKFLNGGIPDALKKVIAKEKMYDYDFDVFPKISHVQQKTSCESNFWNLPKAKLNLKKSQTSPLRIKKLKKGDLTDLTEDDVNNKLIPAKKVKSITKVLLKIKEDHPDYPVFKCFRMLNEKAKIFERKSGKKKRRKSKEQVAPNYETWTEKYKITSHDDIIGNNKKVLQLKKWLEEWLEFINNIRNKSNKKSYDSDSEFDINSSSCDNMQGLCNAMILTGPHGCGKTLSVYVLCNELGINVIELNASSKRTGKRLLQELQEATQSHQVRKNEVLSNYLSSKSEVNDKKLCLLLIEDLDIIFEQDDGFLNALSQLLITSKRPIVITTTDINSNYLQRFVAQYPVINFSALSPKALSVWFQILCLIEGIVTDSDDIGQLIEFYNGDARRTLLQLQLFVQTGGSLYRETKTEVFETNRKIDSIQNDDLNLSFSNETVQEEILINKDCVYNFLDKTCLLHHLNFEKIWWNLSLVQDREINLEKCEKLVDSLGIIDILYTKCNIFERHCNTIHNQSFLKDSVELKERQELYSPVEFVQNLSDNLLKNSIDSYTEIGKFEFGKPTSSQERWLKRQKDCSKKFSELVPVSCHIDRKSYALDYFPTLRGICRSETHRASVNVKRKNRFYNYLRAFDFKCSELTNQTACNIFSIENGDE